MTPLSSLQYCRSINDCVETPVKPDALENLVEESAEMEEFLAIMEDTFQSASAEAFVVLHSIVPCSHVRLRL